MWDSYAKAANCDQKGLSISWEFNTTKFSSDLKFENKSLLSPFYSTKRDQLIMFGVITPSHLHEGVFNSPISLTSEDRKIQRRKTVKRE